MEREAYNFLKSQFNMAADKSVIERDGKLFVSHDVTPWHQNTLSEETIHTSTLNSLIEYIKAGADGRKDRLFVHIESPRSVKLLGALNEYGEREELMHVEPSNSVFQFERWYDQETLIIELQASFAPSLYKEGLLKFVGNLKEDAVKTSADDGITQTTAVRQGVASVSEEEVPNPIKLQPYRTFSEVKQPESEFIFRLQNGMRGALFEADNGAWKIEAIKNVADYLKADLKEYKFVTILA